MSLALDDKNHLSNHKVIRDTIMLDLVFSPVLFKDIRILFVNALCNEMLFIEKLRLLFKKRIFFLFI